MLKDVCVHVCVYERECVFYVSVRAQLLAALAQIGCLHPGSTFIYLWDSFYRG